MRARVIAVARAAARRRAMLIVVQAAAVANSPSRLCATRHRD